MLVCHDRGDSGFCVTTLSSQQVEYSKQEWAEKRTGRFSVDSDDWRKLKEFILYTCTQMPCTDGEKKDINQFFIRFNNESAFL